MDEAVLAEEMFLCEKYKCRLTYKACADRQAARVQIGLRVFDKPLYPGCWECEQLAGPEKSASNFVEKQEIGKEENIMSRVEGTCTNCLRTGMMLLGDLCGACRASITGITDDKERVEKLASAKEKFYGKPKRPWGRKPKENKPLDNNHDDDPVIPAILEEHPRIIPVKLRLDIEVNVRVMAINS